MTGPLNRKWHIGALTNTGVKRRERPNEDSVGVFQPRFDPRPPLIVVADGMGGYKGGALASRIVAETFQREYKKAPAGLPIANLLNRLVATAHTELIRAANKDKSLDNMGSTVVAAVLGPERVGIVNVGDSRAYLFRQGVLRQISTDQSRVAELQQAGQVTEEDARQHPQRSYLTMSISPKRKDVHPVVAEEKVNEGDILLLCSDGLWNTLSETEIATVLAELEPQPAAEKLVDMANISHAADNVSVIVARQGRRLVVMNDDTEN
ncbi:serine/threonine-protein phosphatase [Candidatus Kaiserbacteria bacterium]|nr:serine/threonine-protein phosphatase [Candidatus Kaiserbacteria bacterium]